MMMMRVTEHVILNVLIVKRSERGVECWKGSPVRIIMSFPNIRRLA